MAISAFAEGCRDVMISELSKVLDMVLPLLQDPHEYSDLIVRTCYSAVSIGLINSSTLTILKAPSLSKTANCLPVQHAMTGTMTY
ncbi:hypothetical protein V1522DRAFT_416251 [Lipomyces starkeyi]